MERKRVEEKEKGGLVRTFSIKPPKVVKWKFKQKSLDAIGGGGGDETAKKRGENENGKIFIT